MAFVCGRLQVFHVLFTQTFVHGLHFAPERFQWLTVCVSSFLPSFLFPRRRSAHVGSMLVIICISAPKRFNLLSGDGQIKLRANWHGREDSGFLSPVGFEQRSADEAEPSPAG